MFVFFLLCQIFLYSIRIHLIIQFDYILEIIKKKIHKKMMTYKFAMSLQWEIKIDSFLESNTNII